MEPYDLELGPLQRTFDNLFKSIGAYFQSAQVEPDGSVIETDLSSHSQDNLRKTLNSTLKSYGLSDLPSSAKMVSENSSHISCIQRSDNIIVYQEKLKNGSHRTYNFYSDNGPENMKASFYEMNMENDGEQVQGILTKDGVLYLRLVTQQDNIFYERIEKAKMNWR